MSDVLREALVKFIDALNEWVDYDDIEKALGLTYTEIDEKVHQLKALATLPGPREMIATGLLDDGTQSEVYTSEEGCHVVRICCPTWDEEAALDASGLCMDALSVPGPREQEPKVVCLCGSTRFKEAWVDAHRERSLAGEIVLSVGVMVHAGAEPIRQDGPEKRLLDELHLRKIDLADYVLVLNVDGYIGDSTRREIAYAEKTGKPIKYLATPTPEQDKDNATD